MSTTIKRATLVVGWAMLPKVAKGMVYRAHRAKVVKRLAQGKLYN